MPVYSTYFTGKEGKGFTWDSSLVTGTTGRVVPVNSTYFAGRAVPDVHQYVTGSTGSVVPSISR